jgi:hypothetical protein
MTLTKTDFSSFLNIFFFSIKVQCFYKDNLIVRGIKNPL